MSDLKIAAIVPVKSFGHAKTRLDMGGRQKDELCEMMLEEILRVLSVSPRIDHTIVVTREPKVHGICARFDAEVVFDKEQSGVNNAVSLADRRLLELRFDASIVLPQDIPFVKTQDVDFVLRHGAPPNFAIVVPSHRFDGTNALVRMPADLMETHYDEDSYRIHMSRAKECTPNAALVFARRIMWDVDSADDLELLLRHNEKPDICRRIKEILGTG